MLVIFLASLYHAHMIYRVKENKFVESQKRSLCTVWPLSGRCITTEHVLSQKRPVRLPEPGCSPIDSIYSHTRSMNP